MDMVIGLLQRPLRGSGWCLLLGCLGYRLSLRTKCWRCPPVVGLDLPGCEYLLVHDPIFRLHNVSLLDENLDPWDLGAQSSRPAVGESKVNHV